MKLVTTLFLLSVTPALAANLPPDLAQALKDYDQAQFHNDAATLEHLVADDYTLVNSNATLENKQEFLADFRLPGFKIDPYVLEQPVQTVWGDAAIIEGIVHSRLDPGWQAPDAPAARHLRLGEAQRPVGSSLRADHARTTAMICMRRVAPLIQPHPSAASLAVSLPATAKPRSAGPTRDSRCDPPRALVSSKSSLRSAGVCCVQSIRRRRCAR